MNTIIVEIPEISARSLHGAPDAVAAELRMAAAVKFYELGRLSSGAAADLAGVPKPVFLSRLADYGVDTFLLTADSLQQRAHRGERRRFEQVLAKVPDAEPEERDRR